MKSITFIDTEVCEKDKKAYDFGAIDNLGNRLHTGAPYEFQKFIEDKDYICGHNIIEHDSKYITDPSTISKSC